MPIFPNTFLTYPPNGVDRGDGYDGQPGTPTPDGIILQIGQNGISIGGQSLDSIFFEEDPDSPEIERAEQGTIVHRFKCDPFTAQILITSISRGTLFEDSFGNTSRCLSIKYNYMKGNIVAITITSEALSFDWPPDEFNVEVTELNPGLDRHPRYNDLTYYNRNIVKQANMPNAPELNNGYFSLMNSDPINFPGSGSSPSQKNPYNEARELLFKYYKGEEAFYLPGFKIQWSQYFSGPQYLNPGGYIEDPILEGGLPFYFYSAQFPQTTDTDTNIFAEMAEINPQLYVDLNSGSPKTAISWLRLCDTIQYQRTWFRVTRTWQGAPIGHWDNEIYNRSIPDYQTQLNQGFTL